MTDTNNNEQPGAELVPTELSEFWNTALAAARSGFFKDATRHSQALAKMVFGRELGFGPMTSMSSIYIVEGKPQLGANLIASRIKQSEVYDYKLVDLTNERCEIEFFENGDAVGTVEFTIQDAETAGLVKDKSAWKKHPRNMLFARTISNGAKWYCPDIMGGGVFYSEGDEIEATSRPVAGAMPVDDMNVIDAEAIEEPDETPEPATDSQFAQIGGMLDALALPDDDIQMRLTKVGASSIEELTEPQAAEFIDGLNEEVTAHA